MGGLACVLVPAFDEAEHLAGLLPAIPATVAGCRVSVVVISDGSTDETVDVARRFGSRVVDLPTHRGKGAALRAGLGSAMASDPDCLVTMDADGQHAPDDLETLLDPVVEGEADITLGSRYLARPGRQGVPFNRYLVRTATVGILRRLLGTRYTDPYCGYRAFARHALPAMELHGDGYEGELETLFAAHRLGLRTMEVPVDRIYRPRTSKMGATGGRLAVVASYMKTIRREAARLDRSDVSLTLDG